MADIAFTDATGATSLSNGLTGPAARFANWTPLSPSIGPRDTAVGTGLTFHWSFRSDHLAALEITHVPAASLDVANRLKQHLESGGTCTVTTGDSGSRTYTAVLGPGTEVEIEFSDRRRLRYTVRLTLKNTAAAPMLCVYPLG